MVDILNRYDRGAAALSSRSPSALAWWVNRGHLTEAAVRAVVTGLRQCADPRSLSVYYEAVAAADFILIASLLCDDIAVERTWQARESAYFRWLELLTNVQ